MNTVDKTDLYKKKLPRIFRGESIEFIKNIVSKIILETEYENYMNNIDIDIVNDDDDKKYNFIYDDEWVFLQKYSDKLKEI